MHLYLYVCLFCVCMFHEHCSSPNLSRPKAVATRGPVLSTRSWAGTAPLHGPWGAMGGLPKLPILSKTQILAHQVSWPVTLVCLPGGELAPVDFGEAQFDRVRFFGHPAFALPPYKCDYFTSFTQGTDGPPSPTVETFFDLEKFNNALAIHISWNIFIIPPMTWERG